MHVCTNCHWWKVLTPDGKWGGCFVLSINTGDDFGCAAWQGCKSEAEETEQ